MERWLKLGLMIIVLAIVFYGVYYYVTVQAVSCSAGACMEGSMISIPFGNCGDFACNVNDYERLLPQVILRNLVIPALVSLVLATAIILGIDRFKPLARS